MEKMNMHTPDLAKENYEKLAALFPNAVTETKDENGETVRAIDADVLRSEIAATVVEGTQERYQFTWPDKRKSVVLANQPIAKTLRLDREKSVGRDGTPGSIDTENIYIEGDNLDALKLLQETYLGKVKMIYIDPCCGSGGMFVQSAEFIKRHKGNKKDITIYGQESNDKTYKLARMNLAIRGLNCDLGDMDASTFTSDKHPNLRADFILANEAVICGLTPEKARNFKEFAA